ncbi:MAG TPA: hypothetical protein DCE41_18945 [Cytophagales bacterium]|nr:hypothetical protein [Cytophagales bacterium]HAA22112.1 hypothetical protein [Cytophagales bacterium]HAP60832.1 hypothetical protein [Cytophagales bacterium]
MSIRLWIVFLLLSITNTLWGQELPDARELLERSSTFHDPHGQWETYQAELSLKETRPNAQDRYRTISIDRPGSRTVIFQDLDSLTVLQGLDHGEPIVEINGIPGATEKEVRALNLSRNRITYLHNYYLYLYGLPMKLLTDTEGEILPKVEQVTLMGEEYWAIDVRYSGVIREHDWRFFFDPTTYALKAYQFWRRSPTKDGEFVLLEELETVGGIRHPKVRVWYLNKEKQHIATDILLPESVEQ